MTDMPPPPPPNQSLDPRPFDVPAQGSSSGCQKPLLVGCGVLTLLLGIGAVVFFMQMHDVLAYFMDQLRTQMSAHLPADLGDAERSRLDESFRVAGERIRAKQIDPLALQALQKQLASFTTQAEGGRMSREQFDELQRTLDRFNGVTPAEPVAAPPEVPSTSAEPPPGG